MVDIYGLVPDGSQLGEILNLLFRFDEVVYHDGMTDHFITEGLEAEQAFFHLMRNGEFIRFPHSSVDQTDGGWLYKLGDGSAVIGMSGAASASKTSFAAALREAMPGCITCMIGDQPPPMSESEFLLVAARSGNLEP